jgi:hypothetical protein
MFFTLQVRLLMMVMVTMMMTTMLIMIIMMMMSIMEMCKLYFFELKIIKHKEFKLLRHRSP